MSRNIFITGTDTNVGKTFVAEGLLKKFNEAGYSTLGLKPIASDCTLFNGKLYNNDTLTLNKRSSIRIPHHLTTPFAYEPAIAPHIAAKMVKQPLSITALYDRMHPALSIESDIKIIEGAGGWLLPLNETETLADYVIAERYEVIMVVGLRLGCLNHALLTEREILRSGGKLIGWMANHITPDMANARENIETLKQTLSSPHLDTVKYAHSHIPVREHLL